MKLLAAGLFFGAYICACLSNSYFYRIYAEVNRRRPEGKKIHFLLAGVFAFLIIGEHRRTFGPSPIRRSMWRWMLVAILLFLSFVACFLWINLKPTP